MDVWIYVSKKHAKVMEKERIIIINSNNNKSHNLDHHRKIGCRATACLFNTVFLFLFNFYLFFCGFIFLILILHQD